MQHVAPTERDSLFLLAGYKHLAPLERNAQAQARNVSTAGNEPDVERREPLDGWTESMCERLLAGFLLRMVGAKYAGVRARRLDGRRRSRRGGH
jgi:hypothetical protein